ncbi:hypothetical protein SCHAM137S_05566 [Streptomyces chartreusis]
MYLPMLDGSDQVGVMVLTLDTVVDDDRRPLRRLVGLAADMIVTKRRTAVPGRTGSLPVSARSLTGITRTHPTAFRVWCLGRSRPRPPSRWSRRSPTPLAPARPRAFCGTDGTGPRTAGPGRP